MLTRKTQIDRTITVAVATAVLVGASLVMAVTYHASRIEFCHSKLASWSGQPIIAKDYQAIYPYSWILIPGGALWAVWLLRRPYCSAVAMVVFVSVIINLTLLWFLYVVLVFYCEHITALGWS